jgi:hypothetical protein
MERLTGLATVWMEDGGVLTTESTGETAESLGSDVFDLDRRDPLNFSSTGLASGRTTSSGSDLTGNELILCSSVTSVVIRFVFF